MPPLAWRAARRGTTAVVVALFPALFILDEHSTFAVSPVLPGLVLLTLLIIGLPLAWASLWMRRHRRHDPQVQATHAIRIDQWTNVARILAFVWFLSWLALGA